MKKLILLILLLLVAFAGCNRVSPEETADEFYEIVFPLASYNFNQCIEMMDFQCVGDVDEVYDLKILNTFELWNETKLTFSVIPQDGFEFILDDIESIQLFEFDEENDQWIRIPFRLENPTIDHFLRNGAVFKPNCTKDNLCGLYPRSPLITLVFSPSQYNRDSASVYKLSIDLKQNEEIYTSTSTIEYFPPKTLDEYSDNWSGIQISDEVIKHSNQSFSLFAPLDLNPFMIEHELHSLDGSIFLVLDILEPKLIDFGQDLNLQVYQYDKETEKWYEVGPFITGFGYSNIGEFVYSPILEDSVCTGCIHINEDIYDITYLGEPPRLMTTSNDDYLVFSIWVADSETIQDNSILRIVAQADNQMTYVDIVVEN